MFHNKNKNDCTYLFIYRFSFLLLLSFFCIVHFTEMTVIIINVFSTEKREFFLPHFARGLDPALLLPTQLNLLCSAPSIHKQALRPRGFVEVMERLLLNHQENGAKHGLFAKNVQ